MEGVGFGQPPFCNFVAHALKPAEIRHFLRPAGPDSEVSPPNRHPPHEASGAETPTPGLERGFHARDQRALPYARSLIRAPGRRGPVWSRLLSVTTTRRPRWSRLGTASMSW